MNNTDLTTGDRIKAMLLDHIIMTFIIMIMVMPIFFMAFEEESFGTSFDWTFYIMIFGMSLYFNKDLVQGKSLAKRVLKQEIVDVKTGEVASSLKCLVRNLLIIIWPIEVIAVLISPSRRIGDYIAGTRVEYVNNERNSKPKVDIRNMIVSIILGFLILFLFSFLFKGIIDNGAFDNPAYVQTSFNKQLSTKLENHLDSMQSEYLMDTDIKVYDKITGDSLKYITASFFLNENYIDNGSFDNIKQEIFNSMYDIVPKSDFILLGKFIYDGKDIKKSTWRTYDWRKID